MVDFNNLYSEGQRAFKEGRPRERHPIDSRTHPNSVGDYESGWLAAQHEVNAHKSYCEQLNNYEHLIRARTALKMQTVLFGLVIILLLAAVNAKADSLYVGGNSYHTKAAHATNQQHQFFVYEHSNVLAGTFINSYGDRTELIGYKYTFEKLSTEDLAVSIIPAFTYGYHDCFRATEMTRDKLCPAAPFEIQYTRYKIKPTFLIIPQAVILVFDTEF